MRKFNKNNKVVTNFIDKLLNKDDVDKLLSNEVKKNIIRVNRSSELKDRLDINDNDNDMENKGRKKI